MGALPLSGAITFIGAKPDAEGGKCAMLREAAPPVGVVPNCCVRCVQTATPTTPVFFNTTPFCSEIQCLLKYERESRVLREESHGRGWG